MKSTKAQIQKRVDDLIDFRLDGAQFWHIRQYVTENEKEKGSVWYRGEGNKALSDATLWRYIRRTDKLIAENCRSSRKKLLRRHAAQRRHLYAKAVALGDVRAALAVLQDEAALFGLYPHKKTEITGKDGERLTLQMLVLAVTQAEANENNIEIESIPQIEGNDDATQAATYGSGCRDEEALGGSKALP
jgi:hypothetical protein